ncbi:hypothetical protein AOX55_00003287 [Sinorhizobium fredii CCBAU 25509]|nr:hypothetical protein AOX55_00003287 [Sinorhizobium fredii CCBAU 25509]
MYRMGALAENCGRRLSELRRQRVGSATVGTSCGAGGKG